MKQYEYKTRWAQWYIDRVTRDVVNEEPLILSEMGMEGWILCHVEKPQSDQKVLYFYREMS